MSNFSKPIIKQIGKIMEAHYLKELIPFKKG